MVCALGLGSCVLSKGYLDFCVFTKLIVTVVCVSVLTLCYNLIVP